MGPQNETIDQHLRDRRLLGAALGDLASWQLGSPCCRGLSRCQCRRGSHNFDAIVAGELPYLGACASCGRSLAEDQARRAWLQPSVCISAQSSSTRLLPAKSDMCCCSPPAAVRRGLLSTMSAVFSKEPNPAAANLGITSEEVRLKGNIVIAVHAGSYRTIRGRTLLAVVGDETSFWRDESSAQPDVEIYRACAPALAASRGLWVGISTGYRKIGLLYQRWRDHFGADSDDVLVVQADSATLNPTLDLRMIERAKSSDPEAAETEWGGGFRSDIAAFLDDRAIDDAVDHGRPLELSPRYGIGYKSFVDPSGGRHDAFTLCIGHKENDNRFVVDVVRVVRRHSIRTVSSRNMPRR